LHVEVLKQTSIMRPCITGCIGRCTRPSVCLSVCPVPPMFSMQNSRRNF